MTTLQPLETPLDPAQVVRVASTLRSIDIFPPMCWREPSPFYGHYIVRPPIAILLRGAIIAGAWVLTVPTPPTDAKSAMAAIGSGVSVIGRAGRWDLAIASAIQSLEDELRAALASAKIDAARLDDAKDVIDRWLFEHRSPDPPSSENGSSAKTQRRSARRFLK